MTVMTTKGTVGTPMDLADWRATEAFMADMVSEHHKALMRMTDVARANPEGHPAIPSLATDCMDLYRQIEDAHQALDLGLLPW